MRRSSRNFDSKVITRIEKAMVRRFRLRNVRFIKTLHRILAVSFYEGVREFFELKNDLAIPLVEPKTGVDADFTYQERLVILYYIQYRMEFITETVYITEITKLGYSKDKMTTLLKQKAAAIGKYDTQFKKSMWQNYRVFLEKKIKGWNNKYEQRLYKIIMEAKDIMSLSTTIEQYLVKEFHLTTTYIVEIRYYYSYSLW